VAPILVAQLPRSAGALAAQALVDLAVLVVREQAAWVVAALPEQVGAIMRACVQHDAQRSAITLQDVSSACLSRVPCVAGRRCGAKSQSTHSVLCRLVESQCAAVTDHSSFPGGPVGWLQDRHDAVLAVPDAREAT